MSVSGLRTALPNFFNEDDKGTKWFVVVGYRSIYFKFILVMPGNNFV